MSCPNGCDGPVAALHRDDDDQPTVAQCVNCGAEWPVEADEPEPDIELDAPLPLMSDTDIIRYARGVITQEYMLADVATDRDWQASLMLLMAHWKKVPANASTIFLVPMKDHMGGRWLNGRVPGVTLSAHCVPMENVQALYDQCNEFYKLLHPEEDHADSDPDRAGSGRDPVGSAVQEPGEEGS